MRRVFRRAILLLCILLIITTVLTAPAACRLVKFHVNDVDRRPALAEGFADDVSGLNAERVAATELAPALDPEAELANLLARARKEGKKISIAGARHSMGGHTIAPEGIVLDMTPFNVLELDEKKTLLRAGAGARWAEIIPYLDAHGLSPAIMQSNNTFTVGGSLSVNCHGWQYGRPPIASTVESLRVMRGDGTVVRCSRTENADLFSLVLGGYGLFGIILDAELRVVPNVRYQLTRKVVPIEEALATYRSSVKENPEAAMVYARMNVSPDALLGAVILNVFTPAAGDEKPPQLNEPGLAAIRRAIFRSSAKDDYGKELRWQAESKLDPLLAKRFYSRNQLLNEGVEAFENRSADTTDILHEYFVPPEEVTPFIVQTRAILRRRKPNLLNVTVRHLLEDRDTFLRYADRELFSFVMLFQQERTPEAEVEMEALTQDLIETALKHHGRYYLPYRLHATSEQFRRAYPQAAEFFTKKRQYDPDLLFQNKFWLKYGGPTSEE